MNSVLIFDFLPQVVTAKVVTSAKSPGSKCFGFIVLATAEEAQQAIDNLNNTEVQGQTITVEKVPLMNHFCLLFSLLRCIITTTAHLMAIYPGQPRLRQYQKHLHLLPIIRCL